jgi:hypothetical protein
MRAFRTRPYRAEFQGHAGEKFLENTVFTAQRIDPAIDQEVARNPPQQVLTRPAADHQTGRWCVGDQNGQQADHDPSIEKAAEQATKMERTQE